MKIALAEEMRRIDKMAAEMFGIDESMLMENAGRAAADALTGLLGEVQGKTVCVLAGSGNNGGDAYAAARHLFSRGAKLAIYSVGNAEHSSDATRKNLAICKKLGILVRPLTEEREWEKLRIYLRLSDGVLDGILGTGVKGPLRETEKRLIRMVNEEARHVVAIDIPSGVDANTGTAHGAAIIAETTATFGLPKAGLFFCPGAACAGKIVVDPISLPQALLDEKSIMQEYMDDISMRGLLPSRAADVHKGVCGRVLVVAGSRGMTGAAAMASTAVLRAGAGIATVATADSVADILALKTTEVDLDLYKEAQMKRRISNLVTRANLDSFVTYFDNVVKDKDEFAAFIEYLTINVSEFYRTPDKFSQLEKEVMPELLKRSPKLNIWSAGCSIGAEVYSLTMILKELTPNTKHRLLATDLDIEIIAKAKAGIYTENELKALDPKRKEKYFTKTSDGRFAIKDEIKQCVEFKRHNLLKDPFEKGFDLILCRNVVIYFTEEAKDTLYRNFFASLKPGGVLFVGATEAILNSRNMGYVNYKPFFYQHPL